MTFASIVRTAGAALLIGAGLIATRIAIAAEQPEPPPQLSGTFNFAATAIQFDVSPPLRDVTVIPPPDLGPEGWFGSLMVDPDPPGKLTYGEQDRDERVQDWSGPPLDIPAPIQNFVVGTGTANPPDPNGDVGPNHYVRMSNSSFQIFSKTGTSVFGPANINTLFSGFGGPCQTENAGDPIVLYDQLADRWLLTQFSDDVGPGFFLCVALSTTSDPTGTYFRYAFPTAVFPDYPKFGVWPNAYLMSTRELGNSAIGAYAVDRAQMLIGNPSPLIISFVNVMNTQSAPFLGDGLLPADLDGSTPPPPGSPAYFVGTADDGGPYGATQDMIFLWKFDINFANPPASTFVLAPPVRIAPYDTIYPCNGRSCIPQPAPLGAVDILSYRQRPMNRAAYRNYGSYESIVTNQSVEATEVFAGIRWWELRNLQDTTPVLYQDSTFAPADGVQRWMGSIAADQSGNMALGYSVAGTQDFPGIRYTGRLESDPLGQMAQGEGTIVTGTGGLTATTRRWGDYTSMNVDSTDDCTFWYVNEHFVTSGTTWTLRAGAFRFPECGTPSFGIAAVPLDQQVCAPANAVYTVDAHAYSGFTGSAALSASGQPAGTTTTFAPPSVVTPGSSTLTIGNTGAAAAGSYTITVTGTGGAPPVGRSRTVDLDLFTAVPGAPALGVPAADASNTALAPLFTWTASTQGVNYILEVATDPGFANILHTSPNLTTTSYQLPAGVLAFGSRYYWRVRPDNVCGDGLVSAVRSFVTRPQVGQCGPGSSLTTVFFDNMESGINGWTINPATGNTWVQSTARPFSGTTSWFARDVAVTSDQRLMSPAIAIPAGIQLPTLRFQHDVTMEPNNPGCFDGGFVEISTNGGANWTPIPASNVLQDFYDGGLPNGQQAWCGTQPYTRASLDAGMVAGQSVQFRFHVLTDSSVGTAHGWYVDDVSVVGCAPSDQLFADGFEQL